MKTFLALIKEFREFLKDISTFYINVFKDLFKSIFDFVVEWAIIFYGYTPADWCTFLTICIRDLIAYIWLLGLILWLNFDDYWYIYLFVVFIIIVLIVFWPNNR